jgi:hypothetical protein
MSFLNDNYLDEYILSFLDIASSLQMLTVSNKCYQLLKNNLRCASLMDCIHKTRIDINKYKYLNKLESLHDNMCRIGSLELLKWYCQYYPSRIIMKRVLVRSAEYGHLNLVQYTINMGVCVNSWNGEAMCEAVMSGHLDVVRYLVEHGADIELYYKTQPLTYAAQYGFLEIVSYLVEQGADISADNHDAMHESASNGHLTVVQYLVEHGANIHAIDGDNRRNVLANSISNCNFEIAVYLINLGANLDGACEEIRLEFQKTFSWLVKTCDECRLLKDENAYLRQEILTLTGHKNAIIQ